MDSDRAFLDDVKEYLDAIPDRQPLSWHAHSRDVLAPLIAKLQPAHFARYPQSLGAIQELAFDALSLSARDAEEMLEDDAEIPIPIFSREACFIDPTSSPIDKLLSQWCPSPKETVEVQVASDAKTSPESTSSKTISELRTRFANRSGSEGPWNVLGAASPLPESTLPSFLRGHRCGLLRDLVRLNQAYPPKDITEALAAHSLRQTMSWILLAEAGALITPHQDALGLGTWIHCYEGSIGFAWLSRPSKDTMQRWLADPDGFTGGSWCYKVLRPGDVVYFDPGLVHFVVRRPAPHSQTLAVGGHILRRPAVGLWGQVLLERITRIPSTTSSTKARSSREVPLPFNEDAACVIQYARLLLRALTHLFRGIRGQAAAAGFPNLRESKSTWDEVAKEVKNRLAIRERPLSRVKRTEQPDRPEEPANGPAQDVNCELLNDQSDAAYGMQNAVKSGPRRPDDLNEAKTSQHQGAANRTPSYNSNRAPVSEDESDSEAPHDGRWRRRHRPQIDRHIMSDSEDHTVGSPGAADRLPDVKSQQEDDESDIGSNIIVAERRHISQSRTGSDRNMTDRDEDAISSELSSLDMMSDDAEDVVQHNASEKTAHGTPALDRRKQSARSATRRACELDKVNSSQSNSNEADAILHPPPTPAEPARLRKGKKVAEPTRKKKGTAKVVKKSKK